MMDLFFENDKEKSKVYWEEKYNIAKLNMDNRKHYDNELIEVAAQHPLMNDGKPAIEFQCRLDYSIQLYNQLKNEKEVKIYVPGSLHMCNGVVDTMPLSEAGKIYLMDNGVSESDILANETNIRYKGELGVYNSADECYVASRVFLDGEFKKIHCICSPNQMLRKQLFYIDFGVLPYYHTVPCDNMAHGFIYEMFEAIPDVLINDHNWQSVDSFHAKRTRKDRYPNYIKNYPK